MFVAHTTALSPGSRPEPISAAATSITRSRS
jgi:hypothetical protein